MSDPDSSKPAVYIVDDDQPIRRAMELLLKSVGTRCYTYSSAAELLADYTADWRGCLLLDIRMPGMSGIELREVLDSRGSTLPVIFITGYGEIPMAVEAMQKGAFDFIEKPVRDQELLERIAAAMHADHSGYKKQQKRQRITQRLNSLTKREREVFELVVAGNPNKIIAHTLGVSQRTIEIHRAKVMDKMAAPSLAALVRMHLAT